MNFHFPRACLSSGLMLVLLTFLVEPSAHAVPSFARQTGMACEACHTVWPELTHFGRVFKANGYTLDNLKQVRGVTVQREEILSLASLPPLSLMVQVAYTQLATPLPDSSGVGNSQNGTASFPQQISLFYAGKIAPHAGAFIQLTYGNDSGTLGIDNTDIRFAGLQVLPGDQSLIYGVSLNNNPTVQDLWNTTPAFGFPYATSNIAPGAAVSTQIDGARGQDVAGLSFYAFWNESFYGELGAYRSAKQGTAGPLDSASAGGVVSGIAPYWRLAYEHNWGRHSLEAGLYGAKFKIFPDLAASDGAGYGQVLKGPTDDFQDVAQDLQYQYMGDKNLFSVTATRIHEKQTYSATALALGINTVGADLTTFRAAATYYYKRKFGGTVGYFSTTGGAALYNPADPANEMPASLSLTRADTQGWMAEINYVPWLNTKFSIQYTGFNKFQGLSSNYDGTGRNARDNNTLYLLGWLSY